MWSDHRQKEWSMHQNLRRPAMQNAWLAIGYPCVRRKMQLLIRVGAWLALAVALLVPRGTAQTAGDGAITGTVKDATGAAVPNATVTARNDDTGVETSRPTSSAGVYQIGPLIVGTYSITVTAAGFKTFTQQNIVINQNQIFGLNPVLAVGSQST